MLADIYNWFTEGFDTDRLEGRRGANRGTELMEYPLGSRDHCAQICAPLVYESVVFGARRDQLAGMDQNAGNSSLGRS